MTAKMPDNVIERLAADYIAEDWTPDRYYRDMNIVAFAHAVAELAVAAERERSAKLCELSADSIRLLAGELSAQEMRTVRAVLANRAAAIRGDAG